MDSKVIIKRLFDYELVMGTMDAMWSDISEDGVSSYRPNLLDEMWLGMYVGNKYVGMYRFNSLSSLLLEGHVFMLPEYRDHAMECGMAVMEWLRDNAIFNKIIVNIPECFPNVIRFVEALGLKEQGYNSECWIRGGEVCGMFQYGITKGDMSW